MGTTARQEHGHGHGGGRAGEGGRRGSGYGKVAKGDWKRELQNILHLKGRVSAPGKGKAKPVSNRTLAAREAILFMCVQQLHRAGYDIESVHSLKVKHIEALITDWKASGVSAGTIQNRLSALRALSAWIGKPGLVGATESYGSGDDPGRLKRTVAAERDKSWTARGITPEQIIKEAGNIDPYVAMQLKVIHAFGLRREEAVQFKPYKVDEGGVLRVRDGTKGGRERMVPVESDYQRLVLAEAKAFVSKWDHHIGNPRKDLKQNIDRFAYVMKKLGITKQGLGITAHGLRHQRLNDIFEEVAGVPSPVRQREEGTSIEKPEDVERWKLAQQKVSNVAGHARLSISTAYTGSGRSVAKNPRLDWTAGRAGRTADGDTQADVPTPPGGTTPLPSDQGAGVPSHLDSIPAKGGLHSADGGDRRE